MTNTTSRNYCLELIATIHLKFAGPARELSNTVGHYDEKSPQLIAVKGIPLSKTRGNGVNVAPKSLNKATGPLAAQIITGNRENVSLEPGAVARRHIYTGRCSALPRLHHLY